MQFVRRLTGTAMMVGLCTLVACDAATDRADDSSAADSVTPGRTGSNPDMATPTPGAARAGCAIVDERTVEQAVGFDVVMNDNSTGNCVLTPASGDPAAPAFDFRIEPRVTAFDYFSAQPDATPIPGLGDRAVWATLNEMTGYVVVVSGSRAVVTAVAKADGLVPASRRQAEALARVLLEQNAD